MNKVELNVPQDNRVFKAHIVTDKSMFPFKTTVHAIEKAPAGLNAVKNKPICNETLSPNISKPRLWQTFT